MKQYIIIFIALFLLFSSCSRNQLHRHSRESTVMDTYVSVTIYDPAISQEQAYALIDSSFTEFRRVEAAMTDYADTSEVGIVNVRAGKDTVTVSEELAELLKTSISFSEQSNGAFDVSVGPIVKAWNFLSPEPIVLSKSKLENLRQFVDYKKIIIDGNSVFLNRIGMRIDLGAIAKGYAVDKVIEILKRKGIKNTIVDLGGNLAVWWEGTHALYSAVAEILVRHPRKEGKFFGSLKVGTCGVSTSGDYQRYFINDNIRYHHIIDPATGYPANDVVSVTIVADDAMTADALSTTIFVLGRQKGMEFIKKSKGVEGLIVWEEGGSLKYELSSGLQGKFKRSDD